MDFDRDGARHFPGAIGPAGTAALLALLSRHESSARLGHTLGLAALVGPATAIARILLSRAEPVFARYFDKSPTANWALGWHQDRTIAVGARRDVPGFGGWTLKAGLDHVVPPFPILQRMLILRLHLDPAGEDNAPLLVAPGSHRFGRVAEPDLAAAVERCGTRLCLAEAGDVWAYSAPILHASTRVEAPTRRRVLQLAYSADRLPAGLDWLGI